MKIEYEIYNPCGNVTALITTPISKEYLIKVAKIILKENKKIEQVGMVMRTDENSCKLVMSGGEFCGNACRTTAMYMQSNFAVENSIININGLCLKAFCDGKKSVISIDKNKLIKEITKIEKGVWFIKQQDMTQIVIQTNSKYYKQSPTKEYAVYLKEKFKLDNVAVGIIFFDGKSQIPFIWVKAIDTFYEETACVSGSVSCALTLPEKIVKIKQPSGYAYLIIKNDDTISVFGDCKKEGKKYIYLKSDVSKTQNKYKELEKNLFKFSDLIVKSQEINKKTNEEKLVVVPQNMSFSSNKIFVRESVFNKLIEANNFLKKKNKNYSLIVLEGYRSLSQQITQFNSVLSQQKSLLKDLCEVEIYEETHKLIAVPEVAGHPTGGAVDVCILNTQNNQQLNFGTKWKDFSSPQKNFTYSPEIEKEALKNRKLLKKVMEKQGFYNYPAEWWHFSYGDIEWAVANKKECALYRQIEVDKI